MDVSAQSLARLAAERQFQPTTLERVIRLLDFLDAFATDSLIAPRIALKGGTALNVFHAALDRLSVDIDVNYVGEADKARMEEDRPGLEDRILRLLESKGYSPRREPSQHAGGKWIFRYASVLGGAGSIEIDINYLFRTPLFGIGRMPSAALGDYGAKAVPVLDIHEIVAGKLVALITRRTARDLFDAHRIIAMPGLDWARIKLTTLMIGASARNVDWRQISPEMICCGGTDLAVKLIACLPGRYFEAFGGQKAWIAPEPSAAAPMTRPRLKRTTRRGAARRSSLPGSRLDEPAGCGVGAVVSVMAPPPTGPCAETARCAAASRRSGKSTPLG